ncbi:hypothetical protein Droror1_Dr00000028 [Drosera rotundifolia]
MVTKEIPSCVITVRNLGTQLKGVISCMGVKWFMRLLLFLHSDSGKGTLPGNQHITPEQYSQLMGLLNKFGHPAQSQSASSMLAGSFHEEANGCCQSCRELGWHRY